VNANHEKISRRRFLGALAAGSAGIAAMPHFLCAAKTVKLSATDQVPSGKSGIKFSRLGFGTGSMGGRVQRELGQAKFTALVRHALDRGITYFDTADNYRGMHAAGKGIIAMKLIGNGDFVNAQTREQSIRFVMGLECVDAAVIGFKSPQEIDEAIQRINRALEARAAKAA